MAKDLPRILTAIRKLRSPRGCSDKEIFEYINSKGHQMYRRTFVSGIKKLKQNRQLTVKNGRYFMSFRHHAASVQPRSCKLKKSTKKGMKNTSTKNGNKRLVGSKRYRTYPRAANHKVARYRSIPTRKGAYHRKHKKYNYDYKPMGRPGSGRYNIDKFINDLRVLKKGDVLDYMKMNIEDTVNVPLDLNLVDLDSCECIEYINDNYGQHVKVYTDASVRTERVSREERVGIGIYSDSRGFEMRDSYRTTDYLETSTAELLALVTALEKVGDKFEKLEKDTTQKKSGIKLALLGDTQAILESLSNKLNTPLTRRPDLGKRFTDACERLKKFGVEITLIWLPRKKVPENKIVDEEAKAGTYKLFVDEMHRIPLDSKEVIEMITRKLMLIRDKGQYIKNR